MASRNQQASLAANFDEYLKIKSLWRQIAEEFKQFQSESSNCVRSNICLDPTKK